VVVFALLDQLGSQASEYLFDWLASTAVGAFTAVIAIAIAAIVMSWVGKALFSVSISLFTLLGWLPPLNFLAGVTVSLMKGEAPFSWMLLIALILLSVVFIAVAIWRFNRQEF